MAAINTCYTSVSSNRTPHSVASGRNGLLCVGTCNAVLIYQPHTPQGEGRVLAMEAAHTARVNCVHWVPQPDGGPETELVSGSVDSSIIVWKWHNKKLEAGPRLKGHTGSIETVAALHQQTSGSPLLIASSSADSTVKIWQCKEGDEGKLLQTESLGNGFCLALALMAVPGTNVVMLACGCDDQKIHLFIQQNDQFVVKHKLFGHEDWVRGVDFALDDGGDVLLASCAQDNVICVWRMAARQGLQQPRTLVSELPPDVDIQQQEVVFSFNYQDKEKHFAVSLDSVLIGHDNWVYSVQWQPFQLQEGGRQHQPLCLLSASMDKTAILWQPDPESEIWVEKARLGVVGGNTLGFFGAVFGASGQSVIAHGYQGAFQQWYLDTATDTWLPWATVAGHFDEVNDVAWEEGGEFLVSVGADQTTRLHAPVVLHGKQAGWYELARPQVHGYDLQCLAMVGRYSFASGAEEKVIRAFRAPRFFFENFCKLCDHNREEEMTASGANSLPEGASVPVLGLSNLAVSGGAAEKDRDSEGFSNPQDSEMSGTPVILDAPPTEKELLQDTLWVETRKLYGHGYEIFALDADPSGQYLASACKAAKAEFASVLVWSLARGEQVASLQGPTLTVTQLAWSHSGQLLLAVSRDRTWTLWQRLDTPDSQGDPAGRVEFKVVSSVTKQTTPHSRIIWSCAWSHDDLFFVTTSRDKKVVVWRIADLTDSQAPKAADSHDMGESVTAVSMAPALLGHGYLMAVGLETGAVHILSWTPGSTSNADSSWRVLYSLPTLHHLAVKRLRFRPKLGKAGNQDKNCDHLVQLASCSSDHSVKVLTLDMHILSAESS